MSGLPPARTAPPVIAATQGQTHRRPGSSRQVGEARATCLKEQGAPPAQTAPLSSFSATRGRTRSAAQAFRDYFSGLDIARSGPRRPEVVRRQADNAFRRPERSRLRAR
jgi:hypothetical protein